MVVVAMVVAAPTAAAVVVVMEEAAHMAVVAAVAMEEVVAAQVLRFGKSAPKPPLASCLPTSTTASMTCGWRVTMCASPSRPSSLWASLLTS